MQKILSLKLSLGALLRTVFLFAVTEFAYASTETDGTMTVGKVRASAEVAFSNGKIDEALKMWEKVISMEPKNEQNYYKRFRVYLRQQKLKEAIADLSSALAIKPDYEVVLAHRAKLNMRMGRCAEAEKDFVSIRSLNPDSKDLSLAKDAGQCKDHMYHADLNFKQSNWQAARDHLNVALRFAELSSMLLYHRALCNFHLGDTYEAIADTGKVLRTESDNILALELRGNCYYVLGEFETAMNHYRQGLKFDPEHDGCKGGYRLLKKMTGFQQKAEKAINAGDMKTAITNLIKVIEVDPEHRVTVPKANIDLSRAYKELKMFGEARSAAQRAIDSDENNAQFHRSNKQKISKNINPIKNHIYHPSTNPLLSLY